MINNVTKLITINSSDPLVILLDLDHTIQGNVKPQINEYSLLQHLNYPCKKMKNKVLRDYTNTIHIDLSKGLLRPYFKRFIVKLRARYPNIEFFVYTASEDKWAKVIVRMIESYLGICINKYIFTRNHCVITQDGRYMKSIKKNTPILQRLLKKKYYPNTSVSKTFLDHVYLVDNNNVLFPEESKYLIPCKDYEATIVGDPLRNIPMQLIGKQYKNIGQLLYPNKSFKTLYELMTYHYNVLARTEREFEETNLKAKEDTFWKRLLIHLKRIIVMKPV